MAPRRSCPLPRRSRASARAEAGTSPPACHVERSPRFSAQHPLGERQRTQDARQRESPPPYFHSLTRPDKALGHSCENGAPPRPDSPLPAGRGAGGEGCPMSPHVGAPHLPDPPLPRERATRFSARRGLPRCARNDNRTPLRIDTWRRTLVERALRVDAETYRAVWPELPCASYCKGGGCRWTIASLPCRAVQERVARTDRDTEE